MSVRRLPLRWLGLWAFAAATVPFAVSAHLVSEIAALGDQDFAAVLFAPRHWYFVALVIAAIASQYFIGRAVEGSRPAAQVERLLRAMPFGGHGIRFAGLTFAVQLLFFGATQYIEGCPIGDGDIVSGLITAVLAAAIGAILLALFERRIVAFALLIEWVAAKPPAKPAARSRRAPRTRLVGRRGAFLFSIANRPPPAPAVF